MPNPRAARASPSRRSRRSRRASTMTSPPTRLRARRHRDLGAEAARRQGRRAAPSRRSRQAGSSPPPPCPGPLAAPAAAARRPDRSTGADRRDLRLDPPARGVRRARDRLPDRLGPRARSRSRSGDRRRCAANVRGRGRACGNADRRRALPGEGGDRMVDREHDPRSARADRRCRWRPVARAPVRHVAPVERADRARRHRPTHRPDRRRPRLGRAEAGTKLVRPRPSRRRRGGRAGADRRARCRRLGRALRPGDLLGQRNLRHSPPGLALGRARRRARPPWPRSDALPRGRLCDGSPRSVNHNNPRRTNETRKSPFGHTRRKRRGSALRHGRDQRGEEHEGGGLADRDRRGDRSDQEHGAVRRACADCGADRDQEDQRRRGRRRASPRAQVPEHPARPAGDQAGRDEADQPGSPDRLGDLRRRLRDAGDPGRSCRRSS